MTAQVVSGLRIDVDGAVTDVTVGVENGSHLRSLYALIGCAVVDVAAPTAELSVWMDDEGLYRSVPNIAATFLLSRFGMTWQLWHGGGGADRWCRSRRGHHLAVRPGAATGAGSVVDVRRRAVTGSARSGLRPRPVRMGQSACTVVDRSVWTTWWVTGATTWRLTELAGRDGHTGVVEVSRRRRRQQRGAFLGCLQRAGGGWEISDARGEVFGWTPFIPAGWQMLAQRGVSRPVAAPVADLGGVLPPGRLALCAQLTARAGERVDVTAARWALGIAAARARTGERSRSYPAPAVRTSPAGSVVVVSGAGEDGGTQSVAERTVVRA